MKYSVDVARTAYGFRTLEIEADNETEAREKALDIAGDFEYSEKSSEYSIEWVGPSDEG